MKRVTISHVDKKRLWEIPFVVAVARMPQDSGEYLSLRRRRKQMLGKMA